MLPVPDRADYTTEVAIAWAVGAVIALIGCGPTLQSPGDPKVAASGALAAAANDPQKMAALVRDEVTNGGLFFEDTDCARQFATPGELRGAAVAQFARCLTTLNLQPSTRKDALGDVVVMEYAPGFEVEARMIPQGAPRLKWIGFASRRDGDPEVPSITISTLEKLRTAGERTGPLDSAAAAALKPTDSAWLKVCLDSAGKPTIDPFEASSPQAATAFAAAAANWQFQSFELAGKPTAVCAMALLTHPASTEATSEVLPLPPPRSKSNHRAISISDPNVVQAHRTKGTTNIAPHEIRPNMKLDGTFRVCIDEAGAVESVLPVRSTGDASYDADLISAMRGWAYAPMSVNSVATPVCTQVRFVFTSK